ncbi:hypothetical protein GZH46_00601, partial [Fragariocoptes setiger]
MAIEKSPSLKKPAEQTSTDTDPNKKKKPEEEPPKPITCKAAVAWEPNKPLSIETIAVAVPIGREVRIKILYSSVCHTDVYTWSGLDPEGRFPCILGHEGAGIVESVGSEVRMLAPGDHVIPCYIPQCRSCPYCLHPRTNLCTAIRKTQGLGVMPDGTTRFSKDGKPIYHFMGTSTFSEYTVVPDIAVVKVDHTTRLDRACLMACGLSTGFGAVMNIADLQPRETVAIFGLGTVGLAVAVAAQVRGAGRIIGVDINEKRLEMAPQFGITDCVNPNELDRPIQEALVEMTQGGLDFTFECVGNVDTMRQALESARRGWGTSIVIGVAPSGKEVSTRPFNLITGRTWKGCAFGGWKPLDQLSRLVAEVSRGGLKVDQFITHRRENLESINEVIELMETGECLRCVIEYIGRPSES